MLGFANSQQREERGRGRGVELPLEHDAVRYVVPLQPSDLENQRHSLLTADSFQKKTKSKPPGFRPRAHPAATQTQIPRAAGGAANTAEPGSKPSAQSRAARTGGTSLPSLIRGVIERE